MGADSKIEWTDHTFNPWRGCTKVSAGCANCYAEAQAKRNPGVLGIWGDSGTRVVAGESMWREPLKWDRAAKAAGRPARVFCASMADVFEDRPELEEPRARLWRLMEMTPNLVWLLLTKRPENVGKLVGGAMSRALSAGTYDVAWGGSSGWPKNAWLGVSVENQEAADTRIPELHRLQHKLNIPGVFLSVEPLLGPVKIALASAFVIDWIIVGGESGPGARPMDPDWVRLVRDRCQETGAAFFFKQWGGTDKKKTGRVLDGRTWDETPWDPAGASPDLPPNPSTDPLAAQRRVLGPGGDTA